MKNNLDVLYKLNENSDRVKEIIAVLSKYGLAEWLRKTKIEWVNKYFKSVKTEKYSTQKKEVRIRMALNELGTTFIKLGQVLSTKPDLVGKQIADELSKLQSNTKPDSIVYIRSVVKEELGIKSIDDAFSEFSTKPIASASIAQVHAATLISGEQVVVKIVHKGIEKQVAEDMEILEALSVLAEKYNKNIKNYHPVEVIREFRKTILNELDLTKELNNLQVFNTNFSKNETVFFPFPYSQFSGKRMLTMQYIDGKSIYDITEHGSVEIKSILAYNGAQILMDMIFKDNFYHADPHPGNFFIMPNGSIALIDCGMVGRLNETSLTNIEDLVIGVVEKNIEDIKNTIINIGSTPPSCDTELLSSQIEDFINEHLYLPLSQFDMSKASNQIIEIIQSHHIKLPANISMLLKVLVMFESTARMLNPNFNITELFQSYYPKIVIQRISPKALFKKARKNVRQWEKAIDLAPKVLVNLLGNASRPNFKISLEHRNLENSANNMVTGMLAAALFLGSSMIISAQIAPRIGEFSILGLMGYMLSLYLGFRLIRNINKKNDNENI